MQFVVMANDFFIVHFLLKDLFFVLTGGTWIIDGQYLAVQQWTPNFCAAQEEISHLIVWVRLLGLHIDYLNKDIVHHIGNMVGTTFKVDAHIVG